MSAENTVLDYYDTLRSGDPLHPFFARESSTVKFGISERLDGYDEIESGLHEQTDTTADWTVESNGLAVTERERTARFADDVRMAWTTAEGQRHDFDTRWSGGLERRRDGERGGSTPASNPPVDSTDDSWRFVIMHVSVAREL